MVFITTLRTSFDTVRAIIGFSPDWQLKPGILLAGGKMGKSNLTNTEPVQDRDPRIFYGWWIVAACATIGLLTNTARSSFTTWLPYLLGYLVSATRTKVGFGMILLSWIASITCVISLVLLFFTNQKPLRKPSSRIEEATVSLNFPGYSPESISSSSEK